MLAINRDGKILQEALGGGLADERFTGRGVTNFTVTREKVVDDLIEAIGGCFSPNCDIIDATRIGNFKLWPDWDNKEAVEGSFSDIKLFSCQISLTKSFIIFILISILYFFIFSIWTAGVRSDYTKVQSST